MSMKDMNNQRDAKLTFKQYDTNGVREGLLQEAINKYRSNSVWKLTGMKKQIDGAEILRGQRFSFPLTSYNNDELDDSTDNILLANRKRKDGRRVLPKWNSLNRSAHKIRSIQLDDSDASFDLPLNKWAATPCASKMKKAPLPLYPKFNRKSKSLEKFIVYNFWRLGNKVQSNLQNKILSQDVSKSPSVSLGDVSCSKFSPNPSGNYHL